MNDCHFFKRIIIDKYTGPEINEFSDLEWKYGTGQAYRIPHPHKKIYGYRNGVQTNIGDIEVREWYRLVEELIDRKGEKELFSKLLEWEKENTNVFRSDDIKQHTLQLHASRIFDDEGWCDYISFNRKHFPEKLSSASIVMVSMDCCGTKFEMTLKQIDRQYRGLMHCPVCREYTAFTKI